jgi:hypothetical protein
VLILSNQSLSPEVRYRLLKITPFLDLVHETLHTLARLPECAEPGWLERLEEEN